MKRVVITGIGTISSLGNNVASFISKLESGGCNIQYMPEWKEYDGLNSIVAAPAHLENIKRIPRHARRSMGRISLLAAQAADEAVLDAGLSGEDLNSGRTGCIIGSTMGGAQALNEAFEFIIPEKKMTNISAMQFFKCVSHTAAMNIAQYLKISGCVMSTSAACASSLQAIGVGIDLIRLGTQDVVICGGSEEIGPTVTGSFDVLYATSTKYNDDPMHASRPFDVNRDGLVCGEGSGIIVLEEFERARKRNATIYGEIIGYNTCSTGMHISQSNNDAIARCINQALDSAKVSADSIDYISAHATATTHGDIEEAQAIKKVFGSKVPVSSLKGHLGHTLGASGAIELAATLMMMKKSVIYPTLNLDNVDPECDGILHVVEPTNKKLNYIIKNCFAFGGINASIVIRKL